MQRTLGNVSFYLEIRAIVNGQMFFFNKLKNISAKSLVESKLFPTKTSVYASLAKTSIYAISFRQKMYCLFCSLFSKFCYAFFANAKLNYFGYFFLAFLVFFSLSILLLGQLLSCLSFSNCGLLG